MSTTEPRDNRPPMSTTEPEPTEEQLRSAYEAELKNIRIEHVLLEHVVSLVNLGMRRTGLAPGTEDERDPAQVRLAIEAIRAVLPLLEPVAPEQMKPIRDALSQLQLAFVRIGGDPASSGVPGAQPPATAAGGPDAGAPAPGAGAPAEPGAQPRKPEPPKPGQAGPAQSSGRLWVPGQ